MLFIFDMGGVVTNTFEMDSLCKDLNIASKDFYMICKYKNYNIWEDFQLGYISTNGFWGTFNKIIKEIKKLSLKKQQKLIIENNFTDTIDFAKTQKHKITKKQKCKNTKLQKHKNTKLQRNGLARGFPN